MNQLHDCTKPPTRLVIGRVVYRELRAVRISVKLPLEIAQDDVPVVASDDVLRLQRDFPASTGSINHVCGNGVASSMAAQTIDERNTLLDTRAKVV